MAQDITTLEGILEHLGEEAKEIMGRYNKMYPSPLQRRRKLSPDTDQRLFERQRGHCNLCDRDLSEVAYHRDHIIEVQNGGWTEIDNFQLLCTECHKDKTRHGNTPEEVLEYLLSKLAP